MAKLLISADLHIKNHKRNNPSKYFRLNQWLDLGQHMIESCKRVEAEYAVFAGDLIDDANPTPEELNYLVMFLKLFSDAGIRVIICHGNHDYSSTKEVSKYFTSLNAITIPNVGYYHREAVKIDDNVTLWMHGWEKEFITSRPEGSEDCNVFVGHGYVDSSKVRNFKNTSNVKNIPFTLGIMGDIHHKQVVDNIYIPGVPMQNSFSDPFETSYTFLDTEKPLVPSELVKNEVPTTGQYFSFLYDDVLNGLSELPKYYVTKVKPKVERFSLDGVSTLDQEGLKLDELVAKMLSEVPKGTEMLEQMNIDWTEKSDMSKVFKVKLQDIEIENFKSINSINHTFNSESPLTVVQGSIGTGKSTLLQAIYWVLKGHLFKDKSDVIRIGSSSCRVKLAIQYDSQLIEIIRAYGEDKTFEVHINGSLENASNKTELQQKLCSILPIINHLHLFYFNQSRDGLLNELADSSRVSLISELSGMTTIDSITSECEKITEDKREEVKRDQLDISNVEIVLEELEKNLNEVADPSAQLIVTEELLTAKRLERAELENKRNLFVEQIAQFISDKTKLFNSGKPSMDEVFKVRNNIDTSERKIKIFQVKTETKSTWTCEYCNAIHNNLNFSAQDIIDNKTLLDNEIALKNGYQLQLDELNRRTLEIDTKVKDMVLEATNAKNVKLVQMVADRGAVEKEVEKLVGQKMQLQMDSVRYDAYVKAKKEVENRRLQRAGLVTDLRVKESDLTNYEFILKDFCGRDGLISAKILERVAETLNSDPKLKILTTRKQKNGKVKPTLDINMKVKNNWIPYRMLSGGQTLYADLYLLGELLKLVGGVGFLLLDETFKYFDNEVATEEFEKLSNLPVADIILIKHGYVPQGSYSRLSVSMDKDGNSVYE